MKRILLVLAAVATLTLGGMFTDTADARWGRGGWGRGYGHYYGRGWGGYGYRSGWGYGYRPYYRSYYRSYYRPYYGGYGYGYGYPYYYGRPGIYLRF
jgi:hypothetical protein